MDALKVFSSPFAKQSGGLALLVTWGVVTYYASIAMMTTFWGEGAFMSLLLNWIMYPLTIVFSILYTFNMVKDIGIEPKEKIFLLLILLFFLILVCGLSHSKGSAFDCNILGCTVNSVEPPTNDEFSDDANQKAWSTDSMMLMFFFTSLSTIPIVFWQILRQTFILRDGNKLSEANKGKDQVNPLIPSKVSTDVDTSINAYKYKSLYDAISSRKNRLRFLGAFFALNILIPVHIILTTRLGNNFQWFSKHYIAMYGARTINNPGEYDDDRGYGENVPTLWSDADTSKGEKVWHLYNQQYIGYIPQVRVSNDIVLKLYPDVGMFYLYIYILCFIGLAAQFFPSLGRFLSTRRPILLGYSQGEVILVLSFILFIALFFCYWYYIHMYEGYEPNHFNATQKWARTLGMMSLTVMGFMLLPVSRNSILSTVFGVSWEAMIKFHRWMGNIFLGFSMAHIFAFCLVFNEENIWPQALLRVVSKIEGHSPKSNALVPDNYTVPAMTVIFFFLVIPAFLFGTFNFVRRNYFEVFYFSHFASMILIMGTLYHAASAWYFLLPSLALWLVDHAIRFTKASEDSEVIKCSAHSSLSDDFTEIKFIVHPTVQNGLFGHGKSREGSSKGLDYESGQYVFVNIPAVSLLEVHPFTISSSPLDDCTSLHIKAQGLHTWTAKLHNVVSYMHRHNMSPQDLRINIDGPYGMPFHYKNHSQILLVCGGIGVTPCHSILRTLVLIHGIDPSVSGLASDKDCKVTHVKFVWSCRSEDLIHCYADTFRRVMELNKKVKVDTGSCREIKFEIALHCSLSKSKDSAIKSVEAGEDSLPITGGRPKIEELIKKMQGDPNAIVFVCGPEQMVADCARFTMEYGVQYHTETFLL
jgi:NAD(P)H-flavin reductase